MAAPTPTVSDISDEALRLLQIALPLLPTGSHRPNNAREEWALKIVKALVEPRIWREGG